MGRAFRHRLRVRYSECDMQGVVFNANYLTYFDTAVTELWREAIGAWSELTDSGTDMVVAEARVRYLAPARFDDELDLRVEVSRLGNTAMTTRITVERGGQPLSEGELRHVFVDPSTGGKKPMPDFVRSALEPYASAASEALTQ